jgi:16S rRNA (cytidine1402-2'-O)-methyltransferase
MLSVVDPGTLYVVATPLGNLEDMTLRAIRVLREVALVACEDTRRTATLLLAYEVRTPTTSYFEHNEHWKGDRILAVLREGKSVALVSDAGTPGVCDPGFRLVRDARSLGFSVVPVPGPCAAVAALSVSGLPTDRFLFIGFLPPRHLARQKALSALASRPETLVLYESPQRVVASLADMIAVLGDREAFLCREATKLHEEAVLGTLSTIQGRLETRSAVLGEIVLVVTGARKPLPHTEVDFETVVRDVETAGLSGRAAVKQIARQTGLPARTVYSRMLERAQPKDEENDG